MDLSLQGNNGGDILEISDLGDGTVHLRVGHSCVMVVDKVVPVEFITAVLGGIIIDHNGDFGAVVDSFGWSQEYRNMLKGKLRSPWEDPHAQP